MVMKVDWHEAQRRIVEFVERAARGKRILVGNGDGPVVAIVGPDDLRRLEALDLPTGNEDDRSQQRFRDLLTTSGVTVTMPTRPPARPAKRQLISVEGTPISEQIIADRK